MHAVLKLDIHTASHILLQASQPAFSLEALAFSSVFAVFVHITGARFGKISEQNHGPTLAKKPHTSHYLKLTDRFCIVVA